MTDNHEAGRDVVQHLGDILAQFAQSATALRAVLLFGKVGVNFALQMLGQAAPLPECGRSGLRSSGLLCGPDWCGNAGRQAFELEFELLNVPANLLRLTSELQAPKLGNHQLQMLDLRIQTRNQRLHRRCIQPIQIRRCRGRIQHEKSMP